MRARARLLSPLVALAVCVGAIVLVAMPALAVPGDPPGAAYDRPLSGEAAIGALGAHFPSVAAAHGKSPEALAQAFRSDSTLWVDAQGYLFYREEAPLAGDAPGGAAAYPGGAPLADTFLLHSRPGSKRVIYLDFDGHTLTGTAWNGGSVPDPLVCPVWDIDGNPGAFGDTERTRIQQVWQRVAEDYAPFDVDVTTEQPAESAITRDGYADEYYGMRVLISPISTYFGNYGGVAYLGVFDAIGDACKPALVFPENLANGEKYIGEAASHECGHTVGLLHDGTTAGVEYYSGQGSGETGWAPIMGSGYSRNLTQWSKGEYGLASNTEDDLTVITQNGCLYAADDYPDGFAGAPQLAAGTSLTASGIVGRTGDADVLAFVAGAGPLAVTVSPAALGPDLDVALELRDEGGALVATANPVDRLAATLTATVPAGRYSISIRGTGCGDPLATGYTDYGSLGAWTLSGTVTDPRGPQAPVPSFTASRASGVAPLDVTFDASASHDPDGSIVSYGWDFGDGSGGSGTTATHTFAAAGAYRVVLTVTDDSALSASASANVTVVAPNVPPTASFTCSPTSGTAPLTVSFDGSASSDRDGSIASYSWAFGDGSVAAGRTATHTYPQGGTYVATLTVADDAGVTAAATTTITVSAAPKMGMHVAAIRLAVVSGKTGKSVKAFVRIVDSGGRPIWRVAVSGSWAGLVKGSSSAVTYSNGIAVVTSPIVARGCRVTFVVSRATKTGYVYEASKNVVTRASIVVSGS